MWKEVSEEVLIIESASLGNLLCHVFEGLYYEAKFKIFEHLYPTESDWRRYYDRLARLSPLDRAIFGAPLEEWKSPAKAFEEAKLPEPIFTNIRKTKQNSIVITIVFGGVLKPHA